MFNEEYDHNDMFMYNQADTMFETSKKVDKGYNVIYRKVPRFINGNWVNKKTKIELYTSGGAGNRIRNAETGEYLPYYVGSKDEDLFYKVGLVTGECTSSNGSSTLFFISYENCADHFHDEMNQEEYVAWNKKYNARVAELQSAKQ
jgi:hypothetical protein